MSDFDLRTLSLGAGVQSTTLYLMAAVGELTPTPEAAIFADTQAEPVWVYEHLEYLKREFGDTIPIYTPTAGNLERQVLDSQNGSRFASVPFYVPSETDSRGSAPLRRQCTREFKIDVVKQQVRDLLGLKPRQWAKGRFRVEEWVGISLDEAIRMKPSRYEWITSRWPLIELEMTRDDCKRWLDERGFPVPKKSACYFCPYHDNPSWAWMRDHHPEEFARAVEFERQVQQLPLKGVIGKPFLHRSLQPLDEVDLGEPGEGLQVDFGNECEGMCGV